MPAASASLYREAAALLTPWLGRSTLALDRVAGVEMALAMTWDGRAAEWRDPAVGIRGRLDLLVVEDRAATIQDWKSGWVAESEESLETAWAPGLYAGLLWAAAPRLEAISVEYHYLRTGQVSRVTRQPRHGCRDARLGANHGDHDRGGLGAWPRAIPTRSLLAPARPAPPARG